MVYACYLLLTSLPITGRVTEAVRKLAAKIVVYPFAIKLGNLNSVLNTLFNQKHIETWLRFAAASPMKNPLRNSMLC